MNSFFQKKLINLNRKMVTPKYSNKSFTTWKSDEFAELIAAGKTWTLKVIAMSEVAKWMKFTREITKTVNFDNKNTWGGYRCFLAVYN